MELNLYSQPKLNNPNQKVISINKYEVILDCINTLTQDCDSYLELMQSKQQTLANGQLGYICEKFILFIEIMRELRSTSASQNNSSLFSKQDFQNFLSIFKALQNTIKSKDLKHTVDLIEYELKDNLKRWKISLIQKALKA